MTGLRDLLAVPPGGEFRLAGVDPRATPGLPSKKATGGDPKAWSAEAVTAIGQDLAAYQEKLFASAKLKSSDRRILLVLQAMDCGGKDGTVRNVIRGLNPAGIKAVGFGPPDEEERQHDFLWRIRRQLPEAGVLGVFDRSHYEDVLIHRVRHLSAPEVIEERYGRIVEFEDELSAGGTTVVKVMLHISPGEQRERLAARLADPAKRWKYSPGDVDERELWPAYMEAYEIAIQRTTSDAAPWFVVPADHKWYARLAVQHLLIEALAGLGQGWPVPGYDVATEKARLAAS